MRDELTKEEKAALREIAKKNRIDYLAAFPNLVDLVENENSDLEYLVYDPFTKKCSCLTAIEIDGKTYRPPTKRLLPKNMIFPRKDEVFRYIKERNEATISNNNKSEELSEDSEDLRIVDDTGFFLTNPWDIILYEEIIAYYKERAELPEDSLYDVLTLWAFHTYAMEKANFSPIIYFLGLPEKGKSRMLKAMIYIARRGLRKISITDAQILRDCSHLDATLALDMMSLWQKVEAAGSEDVFLNRPEKGIDVSRVNRPDRGAFADTDYYTVFGPTIFATNEQIHEILDTRAIPIIMVNSRKDFSKLVLPEDGLPIKEKLTAWRACTIGENWPTVSRIAPSRLGDITQPLYQMVKKINPARAQALIDVVNEIQKRRIQERADSISGQIVRAMILCERLVTHGYLKSQTITDEFNKDKLNDRERLSSRKILNKLKTMGFDTTMGSGGWMAVVWNKERLDALSIEYGIEIPENIPSSLTNLTTSISSQTSLVKSESVKTDIPEPYYADLDDEGVPKI